MLLPIPRKEAAGNRLSGGSPLRKARVMPTLDWPLSGPWSQTQNLQSCHLTLRLHTQLVTGSSACRWRPCSVSQSTQLVCRPHQHSIVTSSSLTWRGQREFQLHSHTGVTHAATPMWGSRSYALPSPTSCQGWSAYLLSSHYSLILVNYVNLAITLPTAKHYHK